MNAIALALSGALAYGAADFFGGVATRKNAAATVVLVSQACGVVVLALSLAAVPSHVTAADAYVGAAAGIAVGVAIVALYAALGVGRMGVVSPISAVVGASVPVLAGLGFGERPSAEALTGVALAFIAVALVSASGDVRGVSLREPGLGAALLSGLGIGVLYVLLARGHAGSGLAVLACSRAVSIPSLALYAVATRTSLRPVPGTLRVVAIAGVLDMSANVLYVLATHVGMLSIVAVLTSLYPASTVLLARIFLKERLNRAQWIGAGCALAGVILIAR